MIGKPLVRLPGSALQIVGKGGLPTGAQPGSQGWGRNAAGRVVKGLPKVERRSRFLLKREKEEESDMKTSKGWSSSPNACAIACRCRVFMLPTFSMTTSSRRSGRRVWMMARMIGIAQKWADLSSQMPSMPPWGPCEEAPSQGDPATIRARARLGMRFNTVRRRSASPCTRSQISEPRSTTGSARTFRQ